MLLLLFSSSLFMSGWKGLGLQALGPDIEGCMHHQSSWNSLCSHNFSCHWHCMVLHALFQTTCHRMIGKVAILYRYSCSRRPCKTKTKKLCTWKNCVVNLNRKPFTWVYSCAQLFRSDFASNPSDWWRACSTATENEPRVPHCKKWSVKWTFRNYSSFSEIMPGRRV